MILFGWKIEQWAVVLAAYPPNGDSPKDWLESKKRWESERRYHPGRERLVIASRLSDVSPYVPPQDWNAATQVFCHPWGLRV